MINSAVFGDFTAKKQSQSPAFGRTFEALSSKSECCGFGGKMQNKAKFGVSSLITT